jgi:hypothetical protein
MNLEMFLAGAVALAGGGLGMLVVAGLRRMAHRLSARRHGG